MNNNRTKDAAVATVQREMKHRVLMVGVAAPAVLFFLFGPYILAEATGVSVFGTDLTRPSLVTVPGKRAGRKAADPVYETAARDGRVKVIVGLKTGLSSQRKGTPGQGIPTEAIRVSQERIVQQLAEEGLSGTKLFKYIPYFAAEIDEENLARLERSDDVISIEPDIEQRPSLLQSVPLIGANTAYAAGFTGAGRTVAILDTGVDRAHPFFNNRVVSEACYSTTGANSTSVCPGGAAQSTAAGSGVPCGASTDANCSHGTRVAGVAAGGNPQIAGNGVAKDANIISIQVYSRLNSCSPPASCLVSYASDSIRGLERVYELRTSHSIAAVNLSLAGGQHAGPCDASYQSYKAAIDTLATAGIASIAPSGNDGRADSMSAPACITSAISVGSTNDGSGTVDTVSTFSNSSAFLDLLAPGDTILSATPGGSYGESAGTSLAAAHVTGSFAILRQKFPADSVANTLGRLVNSGLSVTDPRNGLSRKRIRVGLALNASPNLPVRATPASDFDGDEKSDVSLFRPSNGVWYLRRSLAGDTAIQFGASSDKIAPKDFDGDGRADIAVFRPGQGSWYVLNSSTGSATVANFGIAGDIAAAGDYDGDSKADIAIYRPSTGTWWLNRSAAGLIAIQFGLTGDIPVPGDFDGDGKADLVVYRPSNGIWYMQRSTAGGYAIQFGNATDKLAPADYDGDGKMDVGIYRPSQGTWYSYNSSNGAYPVTVFGLATDIPTPGDYDGDGKADIAIFRPSNGQWWLNRTTSGLTVVQFGQNGDVPTMSAFGQ